MNADPSLNATKKPEFNNLKSPIWQFAIDWKLNSHANKKRIYVLFLLRAFGLKLLTVVKQANDSFYRAKNLADIDFKIIVK